MSPLASLLRRAKPEAEVADTLAPLVSKRDALAARVAALRERAAALDSDEAGARAALEAAAVEGAETSGLAATVADLAARRAPLVLEANAASSALAAAEAAVKAEDSRLRELAIDAELAELRRAEEEAEAEFLAALIAAGLAFEKVLGAEKVLDRALTDAGRPAGRGFLDAGFRSVEAARDAARARAARAVARGEAGGRSHSDEGPQIPFARLLAY